MLNIMSLSYPNSYQCLEDLFLVELNFSKSLFLRTMRNAMFYCQEYDADRRKLFSFSDSNYLLSDISSQCLFLNIFLLIDFMILPWIVLQPSFCFLNHNMSLHWHIRWFGAFIVRLKQFLNSLS